MNVAQAIWYASSTNTKSVWKFAALFTACPHFAAVEIMIASEAGSTWLVLVTHLPSKSTGRTIRSEANL